jgi:replicative DNA helicase
MVTQYDTEQTLISTVLNRPSYLEVAISLDVSPPDFEREECRAIWLAILGCPQTNGLFDASMVLGKLSGETYVHAVTLLAEGESTQSFEAMAMELVTRRKSRKAIDVLRQGMSAVASRGLYDSLEPIVAKVEAELSGLKVSDQDATEVRSDSMISVVETRVEQMMEGKVPPKITTGFSRLDSILMGGFDKKQYYILAARTGVGKTTAALWMASSAAVAGYKTLYVSVEMQNAKLAERVISSHGNLPLAKFHSPNWSPSDIDAFHRGANRGLNENLYFFDRTRRSLERVISRAKYAARTTGLDFLVIDYIQQFKIGKRFDKRNEMLMEMSAMLQELSQTLNIAILCLAQLNRDAARAERPQVHQIKDCGEFEQDSDATMLLHKIVEENGEPTGMYELNVAKSRHFESHQIICLQGRHEVSRFDEARL